ncbi:uncharacterized protein DUF559 [Dyadobacter jejuensis]|uniref:type I site-specific deoxyribonuclease n=1 Tax=Dyadobacter jejuensis TaxID=1082580 RepID=A0A316AMH6_9BACT|nr:type I restriction endonuclease [Dyadobacter jejuensis]PWJ58742.1 uncharacterized protein DUF559 [Dyadobacter jejuensis]
MALFNENNIETLIVGLLVKLGYLYVYGPDIAPDSQHPEGDHFEQLLLLDRLSKAVQRINRDLSPDIRTEAIKEIQRIAPSELLVNNVTFHGLLTEGIRVTKQVDGHDRDDRVWLIDFKNPENNEFVVANQFTIVGNGQNKRPDILLYVNGMPLVVIELQNAIDENTTLNSAFKQVEAYKASIPGLFTFNSIIVISDGLEAKAGSISAGLSRFMAWKTVDGKTEASHLTSQLETLILGMLNKETLLDLIRHFIVFEKHKKVDGNGISTITTVKKLATYQQYYAVNKAVVSTLRATDFFNSPPEKGSPTNQSPKAGKDNSPPEEGGPTDQSLKAGEDISPPEEGWPKAGVVNVTITNHPVSSEPLPLPPSDNPKPFHYRNSKNYFSLPFNPKLKARAKELRQAGNLPEVLFWNQVKNKQFKSFDFDRQKIIGNYIVDFYCSNCQVVIEIDGSQHSDQAEYDENRDQYLNSLGLTVIRIPASEVLYRMKGVMDMLYEHPELRERK